MISFNNINAIAKYERRILLRSWFFRIFAILSLFIIGVYGAAITFDKNPFTWMFRSLPSALIYSNMFLLNIFQSVIAVFLATDFLKRDKKLNTAEVLFIRPMTNTEYILGKTIGLLSVFIILNLLVMLLTSIYLLISQQIAFQIGPILLYFILVSIPTLVFIIGLSYGLMIVLKNQPIVFILLLGYIALILFYLGDKMGYLFDYMVFVMPLAYSDIVGFSNFDHILIHRLSYFVLGSALIFFTVWRLNRLPNKKGSNWSAALISCVLLVASGWGFYSLYQQDNELKNSRKEYVRISSTYFNRAVPDMEKASIHFEYGKKINAHSTMLLKNNTDVTIDTLFFSLNPGLKVVKVTEGENELEFVQNELLVEVLPLNPMEVGAEKEVQMYYGGSPDFNSAYLDNKDEEVFGYDRVMSMRINRQYGFYTNKYVLLTKENLWYPVPGITYDPTSPAIFRQQFTRFDLTVVSKEGMLPVSQGNRETEDSIRYHFKVRDPLPQLSLSIGEFVEKKVDLDGIEVSLAQIEGHDYYTEYLSELSDTVVVLITEFLDDFERPLNMYYPYSKFTLVETPAQFASHPHSWSSTLAESQPQLVFFPENGFNVMQADFKSNKRRIKRDSERNKEGLSDKEIQAKVFSNFLKGIFAAQNAGRSMGGPRGQSNKANPYSIFPNYYYYVNYITSDECPVLNYAFESYLMKGEDNPRMLFMARMTGIGDNEKANLKLKEKSLKQVIAEEEDQEVVNRVLSAKGAYLLTWMEKQINNPDFGQFLLDYLYENSYREIKYKELALALSEKFDIELGSFISDWYNTNKLPAFGVGRYEVFEVIDQSQAMFLVKTKVSNYSDVDGMVKFTFQVGGGDRRRGGGFFGGSNDMPDPEERIFLIEANQTKEIQMVLTESPRSVIFNTLLSENIPASSMQFGLNSKKNEKMKVEEYEKIVDVPVSLYSEGELIVDNTDPGFSSYDPSLENPLRQLVEKYKRKEEETGFVGQGWGQGPSTWSLNADADYFGKIEHSAMIIRSGEGNKSVSWEKELSQAGYYDVYVYLERQRGGGPGRRGGGDPKGKFVYTIHHDDGVEDIELELKDIEDGWNLLGSFYISSDSAKLSLSDKGGADRVIADAVKWVYQR